MNGSRWIWLRSGVVLASCVLAGCGSGDGFQNGASGPLEPTFTSIQANIFTPICEQCHSGAGAPFGLRLDAVNSFALLVGVPSGEEPGFQRVKPSDPDNSYLIRKLEGTAGTGERMPAGLPPLPQSDIAVVRQWIVNGALQSAPPSTGPVRVTSLAPPPASVAAALPGSITAVFDRELNATTVDATTFLLVRSGGDRTFGNANDVAVAAASVTVPPANPSTAVMSLAGVASVNDVYRVTLRGSGPVAILDLSGSALDGEFGGVFPSGNGAAGGDFVAELEVAGAQPTLQSIQTNVFTPSCAGCHNGVGAILPGSLNLTNADASYAGLVGVASLEVPALGRVTAGNPNDSYLIRKLEGGPNIVGDRMPRFGPFLNQPTIDLIRTWIANGAPR